LDFNGPAIWLGLGQRSVPVPPKNPHEAVCNNER
jgi:hypothetical protein